MPREPKKVVYLSFAGAEPREESRVVEWAQRLRAAGFDVIDHERFTSYDAVMADIARSDAMVALVSGRGATWAAIEHTASAYGRDTMDGTRGTWPPKPTLLWFSNAASVGSPFTELMFPYLAQMLDTGLAVRLPDDFEAAVDRAIGIITAAPGRAS